MSEKEVTKTISANEKFYYISHTGDKYICQGLYNIMFAIANRVLRDDTIAMMVDGGYLVPVIDLDNLAIGTKLKCNGIEFVLLAENKILRMSDYVVFDNYLANAGNMFTFFHCLYPGHIVTVIK